jgi:hypothetical protein
MVTHETGIFVFCSLCTLHWNALISKTVPSAPADIKAVISSTSRILVSWLPPLQPNGQLTAYTFYMGIIEDGKEVCSMNRMDGNHGELAHSSTLKEISIHVDEMRTTILRQFLVERNQYTCGWNAYNSPSFATMFQRALLNTCITTCLTSYPLYYR